MFIISKRNFRVRRPDGSFYFVKKDFVGEIPEDVFNSRLIQGAVNGGLVAAPESIRDKSLYKADDEAAKKQEEADIRPDAKQKEETAEEPAEPVQEGIKKGREKSKN